MFRDERRTGASADGLRSLVATLLLLPGIALAAPVSAPIERSPVTTTVSGQAGQFRLWLSELPDPATDAAEQAREELLPGEKPGLQFNINPRNDEIYFGWRVRF